MKKLLIALMILLSATLAMAVYCPKCGQYNPDGTNYCSRCGITLVVQEEALNCPQCGFSNPPSAAFCGNCGLELRMAAQPYGYPEPQQGHTHLLVAPKPTHQHHEEEEAAHSSWRLVGTVSSDGKDGAQELPGGGPIKKFRLLGSSGSLIINTFVVREGGNATHIPVTTRFAPGQEFVKDLPREFNSTGFRLSKKGKGSVEVYVQ